MDASLNVTASVAGVSITAVKGYQADGGEGYDPALPVGVAGALTTRASDTAGTVTAEAHGLQVGDEIDLYWEGGVRYGITIDTVPDVDSFTFDNIPAAGGDVLPAQDTEVVASKRVEIETDFNAAAIVFLAYQAAYFNLTATGKVHLAFYDAGDVLLRAELLDANTAYQETDGAAFSDPAVAYAKASNGSATDEAQLKLGVLLNATP